MSVEVPRSKRISFAKLAARRRHLLRRARPELDGRRRSSTPAIYVGNGWFIQSSDSGVALAQLTGWYKQRFAWGRRPLARPGSSPRTRTDSGVVTPFE